MVSHAVLTALSSPRRREILRLIWTHELSAGAIAQAMPDVTFGAVSGHLRTLSEAGLIESRSEHRHRFYRARVDALGPLRSSLERMWDDALWQLKAELEQTRRGPRPARRHTSPKRRRR